MGQNVNVNFKLDIEVKKAMEQACVDMGLSMSSAFSIFAKKVARERRIPFEICADPFYSQANMERLKKSIEQMESTGGTIREVEFDQSLE
ncbi:type II toxin-antitoxin system RelB/DinJ family antitoxin [Helicobacter brantae]|uniref:Type II toxin-antitoxin system antitoxin, RelB/DinJ family n=1 Tax=Helicobacter brantae TaxID=375927 RepID=A0A3D8IZF7_9HELI|nr:type II toxin-antitoxin system RelB/DinJ family antitoxin [Helicobacter brantae]RDU70285.1 type II toxin-antitoxin system antitoxin, RelB/DinJ family [Helicobacter brantae]